MYQHPIKGVPVEILLFAPCYRNWDWLCPGGPLAHLRQYSSTSYYSKWFQPRSISSSCSLIVRVRVVLKRTVVGDTGDTVDMNLYFRLFSLTINFIWLSLQYFIQRLSTIVYDALCGSFEKCCTAQRSKRSGRTTLLPDDVRNGIPPKTTSVTPAWVSSSESRSLSSSQLSLSIRRSSTSF